MFTPKAHVIASQAPAGTQTLYSRKGAGNQLDLIPGTHTYAVHQKRRTGMPLQPWVCQQGCAKADVRRSRSMYSQALGT